MPKRIQLKRTKGFRLPENTVVVSRPSKFGNPFKVKPGEHSGMAVYNYRLWIHHHIMSPDSEFAPSHEEIRRELAGKNLACWCKDSPCHADVLLEIANAAQAAT